MTLRGLHREVERLQKSVRELQFALITQGLTLVDEEAYQKRLRQLETSLNYWSTRSVQQESDKDTSKKPILNLKTNVQVLSFCKVLSNIGLNKPRYELKSEGIISTFYYYCLRTT